MSIPYTFHKQLVLRTPQKPFCISIGNENIFLQTLLSDICFLEALYLASPVLHEELLKYGKGEMTDTKGIKKLIFSLSKYYMRMSSRCTPFGLFSGCALTNWADGPSSLIIDTEKKYDRHTRFDMHYLCALAQHIASLPFIKSKLLYYPNSAFYTMADEIRYVEYHYKKGRRKHIISAVLASEYTIDILNAAKEGITFSQITNRLTANDVTHEEAAEFADELIAAQLVVSEMEPSVTGTEFLQQVLTTLKKINTDNDDALTEITSTLEHINMLIENIDTNGSNDTVVYKEISENLLKFNIPFEANKLFQCDLNINLKESTVSSTVMEDIKDALNFINLSNRTAANQNLTAFANRFYERYEDAELPLLEVLDNETGIGYAEQQTGNITPLLDGFAVMVQGNGDSKVDFSQRDWYLFNKLITNKEANETVIKFTEEDFKDFKNNWDNLPPSFSIMFRLLENNGILLENCGASSAANLLGRFAHGNKQIHRVINDIVNTEDEKNPAVIFAEIVHLPESRIGNILLHPSFRKYEIPFLSKSAVEAACQIHLQDLMISVKGKTVILRSKKFNKLIIPRLSSAHNYSFGALPIYHFLADMQLQGKQGGIHFNWGVLESQFKFLPRAVYKNIIIKEAQWSFTKNDIENLYKNSGSELDAAVVDFKNRFKLPSLVVLADGDNELLVNLDDRLLAEVWLEAVKARSGFILKEFLGNVNGGAVKDGAGNYYANQFIAVMLRKTEAYNFAPAQNMPVLKTSLKHRFAPGSEWVYYKLYCGHKSADTILQNAIFPLVQQLAANDVIDSFFFIRYNDPNFHLRIRFHLTGVEKLGLLMTLASQYFDEFLQQRLVWNIQNDTYTREMNRYGQNTIHIAETLFYHDSMAVLKFLNHTEGDNREQLRWQWAFRAIDEWLNAFGYNIEEKLALAEQLKNGYHTEFNADKFLKEQLGNKYRAHKSAIEEIMNDNMEETHPIFLLVSILKEKTIAMQPAVSSLKKLQQQPEAGFTIADFMLSYIHMLINRIVTSSPREHELIIYDLLYCYYKSKIARESKKVDKPATLKIAV